MAVLCCAVLREIQHIKIAVWKVMNQFNHSRITDIDKFHHIDHIDRSKISFNSIAQRARARAPFSCFLRSTISFDSRSKECDSLTIQTKNLNHRITKLHSNLWLFRDQYGYHCCCCIEIRTENGVAQIKHHVCRSMWKVQNAKFIYFIYEYIIENCKSEMQAPLIRQ